MIVRFIKIIIFGSWNKLLLSFDEFWEEYNAPIAQTRVINYFHKIVVMYDQRIISTLNLITEI